MMLTLMGVAMETLETGKYPVSGDTDAVDQDRCWLVNHAPMSISLALIVPLVAVVAATVVTYLKTMAVARGARQLLLTDDQFNHISHCLSFVMKLLPLLVATLLLAIVATVTGVKFYWFLYSIRFSSPVLITHPSIHRFHPYHISIDPSIYPSIHP